MPWRPLFFAIIFITLIVSWFMMPRVTEKDAVAYAQAMFLEYCNQKNLSPHTYQHPPEFHVEGGDTDLIFVYEYRSKPPQQLDTIEIRINKSGDYSLKTHAI